MCQYPYQHPKNADVTIIGRDEVGLIAETDETGVKWRYYLTDCCLASAKGLADYIGCRSCYAEVDPALGDLPAGYGLTWGVREKVVEYPLLGDPNVIITEGGSDFPPQVFPV